MRLQLRISDALAARIHQRAEESGASVSALAAVLLDQALAGYSPNGGTERGPEPTPEPEREPVLAGRSGKVFRGPDPKAAR